MADVYSTITQQVPETLERLADIIEQRAADSRHQAMLRAYLSKIDFPPDAVVLEIGCGTGAITRVLAQWPRVAKAVGVDPCSIFLRRARELAGNSEKVTFLEGDGHHLPVDSAAFDVVVIHTTLCHVPHPDRLLAEAGRVLRPNGSLAIFDGDYATMTVAAGSHDPLQPCIEAVRDSVVHDPWLARRLPELVRSCGFEACATQSHSYLEASEAAYMLTLIDRGADALLQAKQIGPELTAALKGEARRRSAARTWFGHIAFISVLARKQESMPARQELAG